MRDSVKQIVYVLLGLLPSICLADLSSVYIQKGNQLDSLRSVIESYQGTVQRNGKGQEYTVSIHGKSAIIDITSEASIRNSMASLFPDDIFIKFLFSGVMPYCEIYIEDSKYGKTDKNGDYYQGKIFDTVPKKHHIKLVQNNTVVSEAELEINDQINVKCAGKSPMACYQ